jgi:hypothetical protein
MADSRCWTKECVTDFINLYMQMPCLWRIKSRDYTNKNLKNEAYGKLVEFCKPVFPDAIGISYIRKSKAFVALLERNWRKFLTVNAAALRPMECTNQLCGTMICCFLLWTRKFRVRAFQILKKSHVSWTMITTWSPDLWLPAANNSATISVAC